MALSGIVVILACFFLLMSTSFPLRAEATIYCNSVRKHNISTCLDYLHGKAVAPPPECCNVMKDLGNAATTPEDVKDACKCIRHVAGKAAGFRSDRTMGINLFCGTTLPDKVFIDTSCAEAIMDCNKMKDDIGTCIGYLLGKDITPITKCCHVMKELTSAAKTRDDFTDVCQCIKDAAGKAAGFRPDRVMGMNYLCGVNLPMDVFINTSCKK